MSLGVRSYEDMSLHAAEIRSTLLISTMFANSFQDPHRGYTCIPGLFQNASNVSGGGTP